MLKTPRSGSVLNANRGSEFAAKQQTIIGLHEEGHLSCLYLRDVRRCPAEATPAYQCGRGAGSRFSVEIISGQEMLASEFGAGDVP